MEEAVAMVIGERFAWGHLEKTGGDATVELFLVLPELVRFADPPSSEEKHTAFPSRAEEIRGKVLALNMRRLPSWVLSWALHRARYGEYPDYEPLSMMPPREMAESSAADQRLLEFTDNRELTIDRWLRTEYLADDFLAFVSEFTEVSPAKQLEILELGSRRLGTPLTYDHRIDQWFTSDQIQTMYERNPEWAAVEQQLYGPNELIATARATRSKPRETPQAIDLSPPNAGSRSELMTKRELLARKAERALEERARLGDGWEDELSPLDQASHARQIALLGGRRYGDVLELGCGPGLFTRELSRIADRVVAVDVAPLAIARARTLGLDRGVVEFQLANVMDYDVRAAGPWDLIVMSETIYELGWLYPLFDVGWLAAELFAATHDGGRLMMANTYGREGEDVISDWLIDTCRDLLLNVGYRREAEEVVHGTRNGLEYRTLITLFSK
jgi:SAM-dependent methyltransferase